MKRYRTIASATVTAIIIMLSTCKNTANITPPDLSGDIEISGTISCSSVKAEANISRTDGVWTICYTAPDSISGMEIITDGTNRKINYRGISFEYKSEDVPFITAADYLTAVIDSTQDKENISLSQNGRETVITGSVLSSGYVITVDDKGNITSLSAGDYKFTAVKDDKKES